MQKQLARGFQFITCCEAGPLGYTLHRKLTALGVTNHIIRPRNWDDQHTRGKTDRTDALAMPTRRGRRRSPKNKLKTGSF